MSLQQLSNCEYQLWCQMMTSFYNKDKNDVEMQPLSDNWFKLWVYSASLRSRGGISNQWHIL